MSMWKLEQHATTYAILLSVAILALDYMAGPYIRFPILFVLPVLIVAWYRGWPRGMGLALVLTTARLALAWYWSPLTPWTTTADLVNALSYCVVLSTLAYFTAAAAQEHRMLREEVRILRGILPICSFCKKIRDGEGQWQGLETYIMHHSEAVFSHSVCPSCAVEHYSDYLTPSTGHCRRAEC